MVVVSVSLSGKDLTKFDELVEHFGYASRSSAVRDALYHFVTKHRLDFESHGEVVLTLVYQADANQDNVHEAIHANQGLIQTSVHNHVGEQCVDVIVAKGSGADIHILMDSLTAIKDVRVNLTSI